MVHTKQGEPAFFRGRLGGAGSFLRGSCRMPQAAGGGSKECRWRAERRRAQRKRRGWLRFQSDGVAKQPRRE